MPEACDEKSEAYKAGYETISEISKERIRRAGAKIKAEFAEKIAKEQEGSQLFDQEGGNRRTADDLYIGFTVLKVDSSYMEYVYNRPIS